MKYQVSVRYGTCWDAGSCVGNGTVSGESVGTVSSDQDLWISAGTTLTLTASPAPGYVFAGWQPGPNQVIRGAVNTVTVTGPVVLYPKFAPLLPVTVATVPADMQLIIDHALIAPPWTFQWGTGTTHTVDVVSPQTDLWGRTWIFQSWSDGGASQHSVTLGESAEPVMLTATFVRGVGVSLQTVPSGLKLNIDDRNAGPPYYYWWLEGQKHTLEAPLQQTDDQGRVWEFTGWSNGVTAASQEFTVPQEGLWIFANYRLVGHLTIYGAFAGMSVTVDGSACACPCEIHRPVGTMVNVKAPASVQLSESVRGDFSAWTGSSPSGGGEWNGTLDGMPQAIWANYRIMNRLLAALEPASGGALVAQPASPDGFYDSESSVSLSVTPKQGYRFLRWEGDVTGFTPSATVSMKDPHAVRALLEQAPYVTPAGIVNAAGITPKEAVAPGSAVSVYGASLATETEIGPVSPMAQTLGGTVARIGDRILPLYFASPTQINLQVPVDLPLEKQTLVISPQGLKDVTLEFTVARNAPGLFTYPVGEQVYALVLHEDGTLVSPGSPARRGELLTAYGTGFGPLDHPRPDGLALPESPKFLVTDPVTVLLGESTVTAVSAFGVPKGVALDAVQFRLPSGSPAGVTSTLRVRVNGQESNTVQLPLQ